MKIEYLLQLKKEPTTANIRLNIRIQNSLKLCFLNVRSDTFIVDENKNDYPIHYVFAEHNVSIVDLKVIVVYLTFESNTSSDNRDAQLLDLADTCFMSKVNIGESKFQIIKLYDERSIFYSIKAYPLFCKFESKLRCLILKLLTKTFGCTWAKETISQELREDLQKRVQSSKDEKLASDALYEMDYSTLVKFLFLPYRVIPTDEKIDNLLSDEWIESRNVAQIRSILEEIKLTSNWQRFFKEIEIDNLEEKLSNISKQRNKIAHSKQYKQNDYQIDKVTILAFIKQIDKAIEIIEVKPISTNDAIVTASRLLTFDFPDLSGIATTMAKIAQMFSQTMTIDRDAFMKMTHAARVIDSQVADAGNALKGLVHAVNSTFNMSNTAKLALSGEAIDIHDNSSEELKET